MEFKEYQGKSVEEAITNACVELGLTTDQLNYEVVEKGSSGFLGLGSKPAVIKARKNQSVKDIAEEFLASVLSAMDITAKINIDIEEKEKENIINVDIIGDDMGILIGKRGQTLDSLQYLTSHDCIFLIPY
ncbi:MAG: Jag N-terminal domain-containing protein [Lachnospiraceae bacterium]|nr:Jag N-terminal domain-containing protein [Lachnospiraceae bacterium]